MLSILIETVLYICLLFQYSLYVPIPPALQGIRGCLMSLRCLESHGCLLVPICSPFLFFCLVLLLFLSGIVSANGPFYSHLF